jgi:hypothetical protein
VKYLALPALLALLGFALLGCARHRDVPSSSFASPATAQQP